MNIIDDNMGQWKYPGEITRIHSNNITMKGVPYNVLGIGADGQRILMEPNKNYRFNQQPVTEYPIMNLPKSLLRKYQIGTEVHTPTLDELKAMAFGNSRISQPVDNTRVIVAPVLHTRAESPEERVVRENINGPKGIIVQGPKTPSKTTAAEQLAAEKWGADGSEASGIYALAPELKVAEALENGIIEQGTDGQVHSWDELGQTSFQSPYAQLAWSFSNPAYWALPFSTAGRVSRLAKDIDILPSARRTAEDWAANRVYQDMNHPTITYDNVLNPTENIKSIEGRQPYNYALPGHKWEKEEYPGVQIKPLLNGNPLEKSLSKNGTIAISQLKSYINKQAKVYQDIMNDVINENFNGEKYIDYNKFRDLTQQKLPVYNTELTEKYQSYGLDGLGFSKNRLYDLDSPFRGNSLDFISNSKDGKLKTYTFVSPYIHSGNNKHYYENTIGHSRTFVPNDEPDVLDVMESQSDWAQSDNNFVNDILYDIKRNESALPFYQKKLEEITHKLELLDDPNYDYKSDFPWGYLYDRDFVKGSLKEEKKFTERDLSATNSTIYLLNKKLENINKELSSNVGKLFPHMKDTYTLRQIQENLKHAAQEGLSKMRYPTPETAAKIEYYKKSIRVPSEEAKPFINEREDLRYRVEFEEDPEALESLKERILELDKEIDNLSTFDYPDSQKTILKKYADFPKQYKKIFGKNVDVRTVTDTKGNTWYEVDVPESYKNGTAEIQFKYGGSNDKLINDILYRKGLSYSTPVRHQNKDISFVDSILNYNL